MLNETLFCCNSCSHEAPHDELPLAKDPFERFQPGEIYTDVECPDCGALCFPADSPVGLNFEESIIVLEAARVALSNAEIFDRIADKLDLSDAVMVALREKVQALTAPPEEVEDQVLYDIVRFHKSGQREIIESGLSRAAAKEHCSKEYSKCEEWFDGFAEEGEYTACAPTAE